MTMMTTWGGGVQVSRRLRNAGRGASRQDRQIRVVCRGLDPHAADQVRRSLPTADVREAGSDASLRPGEIDLLVIDLERSVLPEWPEDQDRPRVLALVPVGVAETAVPEEIDAVLQRPLLPGEIVDAVTPMFGLRRLRRGEVATWLRRTDRLMDVARLLAVALAAVFELARGAEGLEAGILAAAFIYAFIRFPVQAGRYVVWLDVVFVTFVLAATGGATSSYLVLGIVTAAEAGLLLGILPGFAAGAVLALSLLPAFVADVTVEAASQFFAWLVLLPITAVLGGFVADRWEPKGGERLELLREANRVLRDVHGIARAMPTGLDLRNVAEDTLERVKTVVGAPAGMLFVDDASEAVLAGGYGHVDASYRPFEWARIAALSPEGEPTTIRPADLEPPLSRILTGFPVWVAAPLTGDAVTHGMLVVAMMDGADPPRDELTQLRTIADETAIAVENARIFNRVRELAVDAERGRLAADLHDGVAQSLTHIRLELELLGRDQDLSPDEIRSELARLSRVVSHATRDVREQIAGLRSTASAVGLVSSLREYCRDFSGLSGPDVRFAAYHEVILEPEVERQVYRIAQEAIANAIRHSRAETVDVSVRVHEGVLLLRVVDDGRGIHHMADEGLSRRSGGVGIRSMRERAERIRGELEIRDMPGGGTRVELRLPLEEVSGQEGATLT